MKNRFAKLTRREFLSICALTAASTALSACLPESDMTMVTLPRNLLTNPGTLYEDFERVSDWTAEAGSRAANVIEFKTGTQSIKNTSLLGSNGSDKKTVNWDLSNFGRSFCYVYIHDALADYAMAAQIQVFNESGMTNEYRMYITQNRFTAGWNIIAAHQDEWVPAGGTANWANPMVRLRIQITGAPGKVVNASFDSLYFGLQGIPAIILSFDDGQTTQYTNCFSYMNKYNIRGNLYMISNKLNMEGWLTTAEVLEMKAAGWTIGNHTQTHPDLTTLTEVQQEAELKGAIRDFAAIGVTNGPNKYLAYPFGLYNADTFIAMSKIGIVTGKTVYSHANMGANPGLPAEMYKLSSTTIDTQSLATVKGYVDTAITRGNILPLTFHAVGASGQMTVADFQSLMDYVRAKALAGLINVITVDDLYHLQASAVRVRRIQ
jgi:peptidoglycan/xylan/chitin deacetylase (PgdA/CDA1 family)